MCIIQLVGPTADSELLIILCAPYVQLVGRLGLVGSSAIQLSSTSKDPIETKSSNMQYFSLSWIVWGNLVNEGPLTPKAQKVSHYQFDPI